MLTQSRVSLDNWLVPSSQTLYVFFPDIYLAHEEEKLTKEEATKEIDRCLRAIIVRVMMALGVVNRSLVDDFVQGLHQRVATMDAASRFDPLQASPTTYLSGIARNLIREQLWRKKRPTTVPGVPIETAAVDGDQLKLTELAERVSELETLVSKLSPGEIRALVHEFGPLFEYSPPIGRPRRLRDPDALPRALDILRELSAHTSVQ